MTSSQQRRLSVQILLLSVDASLRPERCQSVCFLGFRRISRLCEYSQYFTILKAFQGNFTWRLYLPPVQVPLGSGGISSFCDRAGRGPLRRACLKPGLLSGVLLRLFQRVALTSTVFSLFLLEVCCSRWDLCFIAKHFFRGRSDRAFLYPFLLPWMI